MITSDIFIPRMTAPSANVLGRGTATDAKADFRSIGLAERRGFKGAPLSAPKAAKKGSFSSFPGVLSPRTPVSPPTSGFVTTMSSLWASSPKTSVPTETLCFPQHIQDDYNQSNPFDTAAESYFVPHLEDNSYSWSDVQDNLYDFSVYHAIAEHKSDFFKTNSFRKNQTGVSQNTFKNQSRTNIYDMSIYDVCAQGSTKEKSKSIQTSSTANPKVSPHTPWFPESAFVGSPKIWLTPPSAPSSPKQQAVYHDSPSTRRADFLPTRALISRSSEARQSVGDHAILPDARRSTVSRALGLRPLILPLHIAKRNTSPFSSPQSSPETEFADLALTLTPLSLQEKIQLPIIESHSFGSPPVAPESPAPTQHASTLPSSNSGSRSANSSMERRRSKAMVDILSLLDEAALGAAEVLDAINCEDESVDVGEVSLVGLVGKIVHAV
ncbi:hypothetical protein PILCRDRAFT_377182 [Piloderma croceum F 1598]|uniref:Uncharacterized protein n=1 Tax=Piloderma croceum (strain F 1598) TaxID=765440 RepID=A0A0C3G2U2_PILCF|nr:hypothetical protein PILCRDRAFT_377182 [Piloderma croceum F 1598]